MITMLERKGGNRIGNGHSFRSLIMVLESHRKCVRTEHTFGDLED